MVHKIDVLLSKITTVGFFKCPLNMGVHLELGFVKKITK